MSWCVLVVQCVCVCFMNGAALTMKTSFYNLAETTFLHICKCFVFFQSFLSSYTLRFKYFSLFNSVGCVCQISDNYEIHSIRLPTKIDLTCMQLSSENKLKCRVRDVCSRASSSSSSSFVGFINNTLYFVQVSTMPLLILHDLNDLIHMKNKT